MTGSLPRRPVRHVGRLLSIGVALAAVASLSEAFWQAGRRLGLGRNRADVRRLASWLNLRPEWLAQLLGTIASRAWRLEDDGGERIGRVRREIAATDQIDAEQIDRPVTQPKLKARLDSAGFLRDAGLPEHLAGQRPDVVGGASRNPRCR